MKIILWVLLIFGVQGDIVLKSLEGTAIFAEYLGITKLYHETWKLILGLDTSNFEIRLLEITETFSRAATMCSNDCREKFQINLLKNQLSRLEISNFLLHQLLGQSRTRRGFLNIIGTIRKPSLERSTSMI